MGGRAIAGGDVCACIYECGGREYKEGGRGRGEGDMCAYVCAWGVVGVGVCESLVFVDSSTGRGDYAFLSWSVRAWGEEGRKRGGGFAGDIIAVRVLG